MNQSSEENDSCSSRNLGEEIAHASTLVKDIESPVPSKDKYTESSSANFQGSELVEETPTEEQHCGAENPEMITNNASSYKVSIVVIEHIYVDSMNIVEDADSMNIVEDVEQVSTYKKLLIYPYMFFFIIHLSHISSLSIAQVEKHYVWLIIIRF